ncbi:MAG: Fmu (Sun) domain protein, partial [Bacteroidetes bacterium]|nr:Fmu (Sun) domain protein [Bacteroidota bacterium]
GVTCARLHRSGYEENEIRSLTAQVDAVLIDAPCTGVGVFRRNPGAKRTFTSGFVESVAKTQRSILESYCTLVRAGGVLVYCTCTLLRQENEDQMELFLRDHPEFTLVSAPEILVNQGVHVETGSPYLTLLPHTTTTDGFFAAVLARAI